MMKYLNLDGCDAQLCKYTKTTQFTILNQWNLYYAK